MPGAEKSRTKAPSVAFYGNKINDGRAEVLKWARDSLVTLTTVSAGESWDDLQVLGEVIRGATIVGLSEGVHYAAEPLEFRNRVFEYLVKEEGFTAIAIESGIVESRLVHDYVRGEPGDLRSIMAEGLSWTFDRLPQNESLIRWMRGYNADPRHKSKIDFYGFDVSGSPGNAAANRGVEAALIEALKYLEVVDAAAAARFRGRLGSLLTNLRFDLFHPGKSPGYDSLSQSERDALTGVIGDLLTLLERREAQFMANSSPADYEWACRAAIGARQADSWLRETPVAWRPSSKSFEFPGEHIDFLSAASDVRDRAQADNLEWIVGQQGSAGKILVYASRYHLSTAPLSSAWWSQQHATAGTYLRRRFGNRLVTIGNLIGSGEFGDGASGHSAIEAPPESIDGIAKEVGKPLFLLDLRLAPIPIARWLSEEHQFGGGSEALRMSVSGAFDVLFYVDRVRPACS